MISGLWAARPQFGWVLKENLEFLLSIRPSSGMCPGNWQARVASSVNTKAVTVPSSGHHSRSDFTYTKLPPVLIESPDRLSFIRVKVCIRKPVMRITAIKDACNISPLL